MLSKISFSLPFTWEILDIDIRPNGEQNRCHHLGEMDCLLWLDMQILIQPVLTMSILVQLVCKSLKLQVTISKLAQLVTFTIRGFQYCSVAQYLGLLLIATMISLDRVIKV